MRLPTRRTANAVIPTASMADIVFLLIIFFILTFNIEVDKTRVTLPVSSLRFEITDKKAAIISITDAGAMRVSDGEATSTPVGNVEDVVSFAAQVTAKDPEKIFVLKADTKVAYRYVDRVIDALKQARVKVVYLLSDQDTSGGGS